MFNYWRIKCETITYDIWNNKWNMYIILIPVVQRRSSTLPLSSMYILFFTWLFCKRSNFSRRRILFILALSKFTPVIMDTSWMPDRTWKTFKQQKRTFPVSIHHSFLFFGYFWHVFNGKWLEKFLLHIVKKNLFAPNEVDVRPEDKFWHWNDNQLLPQSNTFA